MQSIENGDDLLQPFSGRMGGMAMDGEIKIQMMKIGPKKMLFSWSTNIGDFKQENTIWSLTRIST